MMMRTEKGMAMAQFKFGLIAPVVQGLFPDSSQTAYFKRITQTPISRPDGSAFNYSYKTLEKWLSQYKLGGMEALTSKERSDKGSTRALNDEAIAEIHRLIQTYPRLNATQIYLSLVRDNLLQGTVSVAAVQRYVKKNDLRSANGFGQKDRRAFEEEHFGGMYQGDTCFLPYITENGKSRRCYLMMLIDDHSRLIVAGQIFYNDNAANFQILLKHAVATYGIPQKLYVDHGSPYKNSQLGFICGTIGTVLLNCPVRDGSAKGKIERNFRTLRGRWLARIDPKQISSLAEFNSLLQDYIRQQNNTAHSAIGCTPMERYLKSNHFIKKPPSRQWLDESFTNRITRKVRNDSTISIHNISYDVEPRFIGSTVDIRFLPDDMTTAYILYKGKNYPIKVTNKVANSKAKRNNYYALDYDQLAVNSDV